MTLAAATPAAAPAPAGAATRRRRLLLADAAVSAPAGLVLAAAAPALDGLLGAPATVLVALGAFFLAYAATLALMARRGAPRLVLGIVAGGNAAWGVLSIALLAADVLTLRPGGMAVGAFQALFVVAIAVPQARAATRP